jgi:hypothetical protein
VLHVSSRARLVASVVAVVVLGVIFGAFVVDGLKAPAEAPPAGLAAPAGAVDPCGSIDQAVVPHQTTRLGERPAGSGVPTCWGGWQVPVSIGGTLIATSPSASRPTPRPSSHTA